MKVTPILIALIIMLVLFYFWPYIMMTICGISFILMVVIAEPLTSKNTGYDEFEESDENLA